ncbi:MAG: glycosyltransferase family 2 protein [Planctomycetota bacterium]|jgi:glycosyltransferase involved in cell wall biosynthesis
MQAGLTNPGPPWRTLIIVPCKDERASVAVLVRRLTRALPACDVLVIDDGSTDDTLLHVPPEAKVLSLPFNLGIGGAMQAGYRYAALYGYDVAVQVDGDGQHRPSEVRRLIETLREQGADLAVGSRFLGEGRFRQTFGRRIGGMFLNGVIRTLSGLHITDCTSGFRAARRPVIHAFAHWYPEDYPEPEVLLLLQRAGFTIVETTVTMRRRRGGRSSIRILQGVYYVAKVSLCLALDTLREPWPEWRMARQQSAPGPAASNAPGGDPVPKQPSPSAKSRDHEGAVV